MKIKLNIRQKILLFVLSASIILYVISMGFVIIQSRTSAFNQAIDLTKTTAEKGASDLKVLIERDLSLVRTLAESFVIYDKMEEEEWLNMMHKMYRPLFNLNPHFYAIWDSWEYKYFKPGWDKDHGRSAFSIWREGGKIKEKLEERSLDGDPPLYGAFKKNKKEAIWEPYLDNSTAVTEKLLMASLCAPTMINGEFRGMVGIDITLDQFQDIVADINPFEEENGENNNIYSMLISNGGIIAGHPDNNMINKTIQEVYPEDYKKHNIGEMIKKGQSIQYISRDKYGKGAFYFYAPIEIAKTGTPWSLCISVPLDKINEKADKNFRISLIIGIAVIFVLAILLSAISRTISNPIVKVTKVLNRLSNGEIDNEMIQKINSGDEIEQMANALNTAIEGLNEKNEFATQIGHGNLEVELDALSERDALGISLREMRLSLKKAKEEEEKLKEEDTKRRWTNEGLATFGDILRQNYTDQTELSYSIIKNLVHYLNANQGGIFIKDDKIDEGDKDVFLLDAAFAFDRRKFLKKEIELGDGLVGTCAIEKQTIYLTDIPEDYIEITSGLGGSNPKSILIVPLRLEEDVYGILEIASFNTIEPHEIEFVEKIGENIASTISAVKVNTRTTMLLEKSQQQAEEMAAQEEEMRQNLEELQATQEEMARKRAEGEAIEDAMNSSVGIIEMDMNKRIINVNDYLVDIIGVQKEELVGKFHFDLMTDERINEHEYNEIWKGLPVGQKYQSKSTYFFTHRGKKFKESFVPARDEAGDYAKVILVLNEI